MGRGLRAAQKHDQVARLALGTVQFGLDYGISNTTGRVGQADARAILSRARELGIDTLDTAIAYGDSESQLGQAGIAGFRVVTKLPPVPDATTDVAHWVEGAVRASLKRLGIERLEGLLLHHPGQLLQPAGTRLHTALVRLREAGLASKIGISIYDPAELDALAEFPIDLVQAPINLLDRRMEASGWLSRCRAAGIEVHARSAFLQGLLLMRAAERPAGFGRWSALWSRYDEWLRETGVTALEASLRYVLSLPEVDKVVVGVVSADQLSDIVRASASQGPIPPAEIQAHDAELLNPSHWNTR